MFDNDRLTMTNDQDPLEANIMAAPTSPIAISRLGQIAINVQDLNRATAFYRDILGLPLLFTAGSLAFFDCGGVRLMLTYPEKSEFDHPSSILYFTVPDIAAAHRQMLSSGVRFEDEPHLIARMPTHDLWMVFFRDSEKNFLGLMCEMPKAG
jgi:methylmalonyl-CoA/ethylmalonyl-CoA epimerase